MSTKQANIQQKTVKKHHRFSKSDLQLYSLCALPVLFVFLFSYVPMFGIIIAFKDFKFNRGIFGSKWVGMRNFEFFINSNDFMRITWNTLSLNVIFIATGIVASVLVAIFLFDIRQRTAVKTYQTIFITPHFMSWVIVSYMVYAFLSPTSGLLNSFLGLFGKKQVDWYSTPSAWTAILTVCSVWKHVGMDCVVYYASLMGIDTSLFEAAKIDGANKFQIMMKITIPSLVPLITILTILKIGSIFRADFGLFYQVTRDVGTLYPRTDVIDTYVYRTMRTVGDMSMASAIGLLQSVVGFVLVMVTNYITRKIDPSRALF